MNLQVKVELPSQAILLKQKQTIKQCLRFVIDLCLLIVDLRSGTTWNRTTISGLWGRTDLNCRPSDLQSDTLPLSYFPAFLPLKLSVCE